MLPTKERRVVRINYNGIDFLFHCYIRDLIASELIKTRTFYELPLLDYIKSFNLSGVYLDVGANVGNHSVFFSVFCNSTRVISIEPCPQNCELLQDNLNEHTVKPHDIMQIAADSKPGRVGLVCDNELNMGHIVACDGDEVESNAIDAVLGKLSVNDRIAVIKLDVEGMEYNAILGAMQTIIQHKPLISAECWNEIDRLHIDTLLKQFGYSQVSVFGPSPTYVWIINENS